MLPKWSQKLMDLDNEFNLTQFFNKVQDMELNIHPNGKLIRQVLEKLLDVEDDLELIRIQKEGNKLSLKLNNVADHNPLINKQLEFALKKRIAINQVQLSPQKISTLPLSQDSDPMQIKFLQQSIKNQIKATK